MHILADGKFVIFQGRAIDIVNNICIRSRVASINTLLVLLNLVNCFLNQFVITVQCQLERIDGTFQALEHVDAHEFPNAHFAAKQQILFFGTVDITLDTARVHKSRRAIHTHLQLAQQQINAIERNSRHVGQVGRFRNRRQPFRELAHLIDVVKFFDMLAGTRYRYRIEQFKEIKIQRFKQRLRSSLRGREFYPRIVGTLRLLENGINAVVQVQQRIHLFRIVFVGQAQLVLQIVEAIVHRRCRKHQHLRLHALANDLIQQTLIAVFLAVDIIVKFIGRKILACGRTAITEIMGFINDD